MEELFDNKNSALLVMDVQGPIVSMLPENGAALLNTLAKTVAAARNKEIQVIYVVIGFRKDYPEINPRNRSFSSLKNSGRNFDTEEGMKVSPLVIPHPGDITVVKKRVSAFTGSDLEVVLRSRNIQHLVLTGIATSGVVLSTLREAADKDYRITVLSDCCGDADAQVHDVLTIKVFPRQAEVLTHDQWIKNI